MRCEKTPVSAQVQAPLDSTLKTGGWGGPDSNSTVFAAGVFFALTGMKNPSVKDPYVILGRLRLSAIALGSRQASAE